MPTALRQISEMTTGGLTFLSLLSNLLRDKSLDAASGDTELARNMRGLRTVGDQLSHWVGIDTWLTASIIAFAFASSISSSCRSR
jgi:hypothetical protein